MKRMLATLVLTYIALVLGAYLLAERLIFLPPPSSYGSDELSIRRVEVGARDSLALLHLPNDSAGYTIIYSHGNAEDLGHLLPLLEILHGAGFGVIAYDYRGYGKSTRVRPTVRRAIEDAEAVYHFAVDELGIPPERLILHGRSVGSGPTVEVARRHRVAGVILESAFTSTYRVMTRIPLLPLDRFVNIRGIRRVQAPILIIHGGEDEIIRPAHGRALYAAASEPKQILWVDRAGHNDLVWVAGEEYTDALHQFVGMIDRSLREN